MSEPIYTNRMNIQTKDECGNCKSEDYDYKFYLKDNVYRYYCEPCAIKLKLTSLESEFFKK